MLFRSTLLQGFTGITMQLRAIQRVLTRRPNEGAAALETVLTSADAALRDARNAIWDMRAVELDGRDLPEALPLLSQRDRDAGDHERRLVDRL